MVGRVYHGVASSDSSLHTTSGSRRAWQLKLARGTVATDGLEEQVQDAEALGDEQQVPDGIEERHRALNRSSGHGLALDGGELVMQLGHANSASLVDEKAESKMLSARSNAPKARQAYTPASPLPWPLICLDLFGERVARWRLDEHAPRRLAERVVLLRHPTTAFGHGGLCGRFGFTRIDNQFPHSEDAILLKDGDAWVR
jgi:hypothetical protein